MTAQEAVLTVLSGRKDCGCDTANTTINNTGYVFRCGSLRKFRFRCFDASICLSPSKLIVCTALESPLSTEGKCIHMRKNNLCCPWSPERGYFVWYFHFVRTKYKNITFWDFRGAVRSQNSLFFLYQQDNNLIIQDKSRFISQVNPLYFRNKAYLHYSMMFVHEIFQKLCNISNSELVLPQSNK